MKIHNYLLAFSGTLILLASGHVIVFYKYFQVFIHQTLYYCQELIKALNFQPPSMYGKIIAGMLILATVFTLIRLFRSVVSISSFRRVLLKETHEHSDDVSTLLTSLGLQAKVIIFNEAKPRAFCFGIRNPKIYISTALVQLMNQNELEIILKHEKYHLEHRDTLTLFLAAIVESLFPFFPIASDFIRLYRTDREIKADHAAIVTETDTQSLKEVFKKLIQYEPEITPVFLPGVMSMDTLEARILSLRTINTFHIRLDLRNLVLSLISLIVLFVLMITPVNAVELHQDGQDVVMLCDKQTLQLLQSNQPLYTPASTKNFSFVK